MFSRCSVVFVWLCLAVASVPAASPYRQPVNFSYTGDVGIGNGVFVVGNHPDVGAWDVTKAVKLRWTTGNVWTAQIGIQSGTALQYAFISRAASTDRWGDPSNAIYLTGTQTQTVAAQPTAPYVGKTIYYLSGWARANLFYQRGTTWTTAAMTAVAAGRSNGESLYKVTGVGEAGEALEFVFNDGSSTNTAWDNPPGGGNYLTSIDVFSVQDGNVFSYQPPPVVSTPRIVTQSIDSTAPNIAGRNVHIYLPRGYTQNLWKRYPVLYLHDGQNVFDPGGPFGSWSADATATREIGQGRVRETIIVGVDNSADRIPEYQPPGDAYNGVAGRADAYASFLLNNVRPYVDAHYRTLNDPANTLTAGSSLGGLVSLYLGREFSVFGKIGVLSPAFWISPNYLGQVAGETRKALRVYLDMGSSEGSSYWNDCQGVYDLHLAQGYCANSELTFAAGIGQAHNESAWASRLPGALRFLLPAVEDPPRLAQRDYPPRVSVAEIDSPNHRAGLSYSGLFGFSYDLERSTDLQHWFLVLSTPAETLPWAVRRVDDSGISTVGSGYWRLRYDSGN